jgi:methionine biosynthesis protein MetW
MNSKYQTIIKWIEPDTHVLDLGCSSGELLSQLISNKNISGYGLELDKNKIVAAIGAGINVIDYDLNQGLAQFSDNSFDYALLTETLQAIAQPDLLVDEMLRIASSAIITFPNFNYYSHLYQLLVKRRMPVSRHIPHTWYNSPNVHLCTMGDFEDLCKQKNWHIHKRDVLGYNNSPASWLARLLPVFFAPTAMYQICKK